MITPTLTNTDWACGKVEDSISVSLEWVPRACRSKNFNMVSESRFGLVQANEPVTKKETSQDS